MSVPYTMPVLNTRLNAVVSQIDANGNGGLNLYDGNGVVLTSFQLARPCGTVANGVLTFSGQIFDTSARNTGIARYGIIYDALSTTVVYGLTVVSSDLTTSGDIRLFNGLGNTMISSGQVIEITSATITGA